MATITVRNLDEGTKDALAARAAEHGRSMEAEARVILAAAVSSQLEYGTGLLGSRIRARFSGLDWEPAERSQEAPRGAEFS